MSHHSRSCAILSFAFSFLFLNDDILVMVQINSGTEWNKHGANCSGETQALTGSMYPVGQPLALDVQKKVVSKMDSPVGFLDITVLSQLRIDGHPSFYGVSRTGIDCTHWCLAGVPDTWNLIMYNLIFSK